jgi:putative SOS response-associated peptidase YedK
MCGRYALTTDPHKLARRFGAEPPPDLQPRYNIAPSQNIPIVRQEGEGRRFALARWGLVPSWAKEISFGGYSTINARAETVAGKPAYSSAFRHRRALIPASGYYEWQAQAEVKVKQPWFIALKDKEPMAFAGLWEHWTSPEGEALESCCIIVTDANTLTRPIHDRMPVILDPVNWGEWLDPEAKDHIALQALLKPYPAEAMTVWPVGTLVNNPRHDAPDCLERVA